MHLIEAAAVTLEKIIPIMIGIVSLQDKVKCSPQNNRVTKLFGYIYINESA